MSVAQVEETSGGKTEDKLDELTKQMTSTVDAQNSALDRLNSESSKLSSKISNLRETMQKRITAIKALVDLSETLKKERATLIQLEADLEKLGGADAAEVQVFTAKIKEQRSAVAELERQLRITPEKPVLSEVVQTAQSKSNVDVGPTAVTVSATRGDSGILSTLTDTVLSPEFFALQILAYFFIQQYQSKL